MLTKQFAKTVKSIDRERNVITLLNLKSTFLKLKLTKQITRQAYFELSDLVLYRLDELSFQSGRKCKYLH
jgi:hypothetical protein